MTAKKLATLDETGKVDPALLPGVVRSRFCKYADALSVPGVSALFLWTDASYPPVTATPDISVNVAENGIVLNTEGEYIVEISATFSSIVGTGTPFISAQLNTDEDNQLSDGDGISVFDNPNHSGRCITSPVHFMAGDEITFQASANGVDSFDAGLLLTITRIDGANGLAYPAGTPA